jgi:hypothetical protein
MPVTNAINLSLLMVTVLQFLLRNLQHEHSNVNVLDLKALYRCRKYVVESIFSINRGGQNTNKTLS